MGDAIFCRLAEFVVSVRSAVYNWWLNRPNPAYSFLIHVSSPNERLVISADEVARASTGAPPMLPSSAVEANARQPSWRSRAALAPTVLALPLLCAAAVILRLANRRRPLVVKAAWNSYLTTLLVISGLLNSLLLAGLLSRGASPTWFSGRLQSLDMYDGYPAVEQDRILGASEIFGAFKPLLFIVAPVPKFGLLANEYLQHASIGSAFLVATMSDGYVLATNRHVADAEGGWLARRDSSEVLLFSYTRDMAKARVIARHSDLDMALLWLAGTPAATSFRQPIAAFEEVAVGDRVYVLGHPERLFFSMSDGMISRIADRSTIQITAPISPGSSGGPVLDERGNLVGLVSSTLDRRFEPNAQNLNFAISADVLVRPEGWVVESADKQQYEAFLAAMQSNAKTTPRDETSGAGNPKEE